MKKNFLFYIFFFFSLFILNTNNVFAEEVNLYRSLSLNNNKNYARIYSYDTSNSSYYYNWGSVPIFNDTNLFFGRNSNTGSPYLILHEKTNDVYFYFGYNVSSSLNLTGYDYVDLVGTSSNTGYNFSARTFDNSSSRGFTLTNFYSVSSKPLDYAPTSSYAWANNSFEYNNHTIYENVYPTYDYRINFFDYFVQNFSSSFEVFYHSGFNVENFRLNGVDLPIHSDIVVPSGYQKIDMFNKYAVMFYAKDYRNVPTSCIKYRDSVETDDNGNVNIIQVCDEYGFDFDFYYKGKFNQAYVQSSQLVRVYDPIELEFSSDIVNYKFTNDVFNSFQPIFYNTNEQQITDDNGNVVLYYGEGEVWYDSDLYNYVLIDDYNTVIDTDICYITYLGVDGCVHINSEFPNSHDTHNVYEKESSDLLHNFRTDLHGLSGIITMPLVLFNQIQSGSCYDLVLPLPFVNKELRLPCMTTFYSRFTGIFSLYQTITFGLVSYYICVNLLATIKKLKDVDDDEIEVIEL